jgi:hypothetical protein
MKQQVLNINYVCISIFFPYAACISHLCGSALGSGLWPLCLYRVPCNYLVSGTTFGEKYLTLSLQLVSGTFLNPRRIQRGINVSMSSSEQPVVSVRFNQPELSRADFRNTATLPSPPQYNIHENPSRENRVVPCGRTDGQT